MQMLLEIFQVWFGTLTCPAFGSTNVQTSHGGKICTCQGCGYEWES